VRQPDQRDGGSDLGLEHVELSDERSELRVHAFMGGANIRVPVGMNLDVSEFAFMGGNGVDVGDPRPHPGGPVLRVRLFSFMGGTDVRRRRRKRPRRRHQLHH
jgi:hypothetical protein